jgi:hypothetical protein
MDLFQRENNPMIKNTRVFVCYTKRDGLVSSTLLEKLFENLDEICFPFIHDLSKKFQTFEQLSVIKSLLYSHILILIESPQVYRSPWVKFELLISKIKMQPIITLSVSDLLKL